MNLIIIPVHIQKMNWAMSLMTGIRTSGGLSDDVSLAFVLSNELEVTKFSELLVSLGFADRVILIDAANYSRVAFPSGLMTHALETNANRGIVNLKKFLGLHWAWAKSYDFVAVLDIDIYLSPNADLGKFFRILKSNYAANRVIGVSLPGNFENDIFQTINRKTLELFSQEDSAALQRDGVSDVFSWFFEPPTYAREDLSALFDYMKQVHGSLGQFFLNLNWHTFDHTIFTYFRVLRGASLFSYDSLGIATLPEHLSVAELDMIRSAIGFEPPWISFFSELLSAPSARLLFPDLGVFFHFDRVGR